MAVTQIVGPRIAPLWADPAEWTSIRAYEPFTFVTYQGDSYCSRQDTPIGIQIANDDYWVKVSDYNAQAVALQRSMTQTIETAETNMANAIQTAENSMTSTINTAESNMAAQVSAVEDSMTSTINTAESNMAAQVSAVESVKDEFQSSLDSVAINTATITKNRRIAAQRNMQMRFAGQYVGHQGNFLSAPGNTKPSYDAAIAAGYKILECDVHSTSDGVLVLCHDNDLSIWTDVTGTISGTSYADLMQINITKGSHASRYNNLHFYRLIDYLKQCSSNGCIAFLDDKLSNPILIADTCVNTIGFNNWCYLGSIENCNAILSKYPDAAACAVSQNPSENDWINAEAYQLIGIHTMAANITQDMVNSAHDKGLLIGGWSTNEQGTIKRILDLGVDFINVDGTWYTVQMNDNSSGPLHSNHAHYLSPIAAELASKHIANIANGSLLGDNIDFESQLINASNLPGSSALVDVSFGGNIQAVYINKQNDFYRYSLRSFVENGAGWGSAWLEETGIYYVMACKVADTASNNTCFTIAAGNTDSGRNGDVDLLNARDNIKFVDDAVSKNLQLTYNNVMQHNHLYMTPVPAQQNDTFDYFASDSDGTDKTIRYSIYELNAQGLQIHDSGYLTNNGTYTCVNAKTRFIQCVFTPISNVPLSKAQVIGFMPIMQTFLGL